MHFEAYLQEFKRFKKVILILLCIIFCTFLFFNLSSINIVIFFAKEDSIFEWATSLFYFLTFLFLILTYKIKRNIFILLLALVMCFGALEEISWGQRIFNFETPDFIKKRNVQAEFTVHNLKYFSHKQFAHEAKNSSGKIFEIDFAFKIFMIFFGIILPFCTFHFKSIQVIVQKLKVPVPPITVGMFSLFSWLALKISFVLIPKYMDTDTYDAMSWAATEIFEFNTSLILTFIALYFYKNRYIFTPGKDFKQEFLIPV